MLSKVSSLFVYPFKSLKLFSFRSLPLLVLTTLLISCGGGGGGGGVGSVDPTLQLPPEPCQCDADCADYGPEAYCNPVLGVCAQRACVDNADCLAMTGNPATECAQGYCVIPRCRSDADCNQGPLNLFSLCTVLLQCRNPNFVGVCPLPNQTIIDGECRVDQSSCDPGAECGNGIVEPGEACDDGLFNSDVTPDACRMDCSLPNCGDGVIDPANNENCESDGDCPNGFCEPSNGANPCQCVQAVGDLDGDGVDDDQDNCVEDPNPDQADLDQDGMGDACDADADGDALTNDDEEIPDPQYQCATDPLDADTDDDGLSDSVERSLNPPTNPCAADTDGDGANDADDPVPTDPNQGGDLDGDGISNEQDNCVVIPNPDQDDGDNDGRGDACDNCVDVSNNAEPDVQMDTDQDGVGDACDNCPNFPNAGQEDNDGDSFGDACDLCEGSDDAFDADGDGIPDGCDDCPDDPDNDSDQDNVCGDLDNCPNEANPNQGDVDGDSVGDLCDNCPDDPNPGQDDSDGNGTGDACEGGGCNLVCQIVSECETNEDCQAGCEICNSFGFCIPYVECTPGLFPSECNQACPGFDWGCFQDGVCR